MTPHYNGGEKHTVAVPRAVTVAAVGRAAIGGRGRFDCLDLGRGALGCELRP